MFAATEYNLSLTMRTLLLACLLTGSAFAQTGKLGPFTNSGDVGGPAMKGSTEFDGAKGQFRMTGAGAPFGGLAGTIFVAFIGAVVLLLLLRLIHRMRYS